MNGSKYRHDTLDSEPVAVEVRQEAMIGNGPGRCGLNAQWVPPGFHRYLEKMHHRVH